ncbi:MAG: bifunctional adenosylcobinamide kinase/adenosylcobinamide-phosphate guanylyltransferase [Clostridia bacterium]|nr:bifunctional adenosylcobinamide kinase/adenosylcobinamide-phosphate guanylyltransferase [Clostridia bacterium]
MKLYIGGICQGQEELARKDNPGAEMLVSFHEAVRDALSHGEDPRVFASRVCREKPDRVIVADEVGAGIVPIDAGERAYREAVGRALCVIAQFSQEVWRVTCGIGVRIK